MTPLEHITGLMDPSYPEPVRRSMAQGILDKHAHGLAEQQRAALGDVMDRWFGNLHQDAFSELIDLIDPKTQPTTTNEEAS